MTPPPPYCKTPGTFRIVPGAFLVIEMTLSFSSKAPPLGELARERLRGQGCYRETKNTEIASL